LEQLVSHPIESGGLKGTVWFKFGRTLFKPIVAAMLDLLSLIVAPIRIIPAIFSRRVPTAVDFCNLDRILMGSGLCNSHSTTPDKLRSTYIDVWGGTLSGSSGSRGSLVFGDIKGYYWSATEYDESYAFYLYYSVHGIIKSQCTDNTKALGFSLRCVRDAE
jgi:hypothetical protein